MAVVDGSIQLGHQLAAWFTTNAALVLLDGQIVYCKDGANAGKYKIGDGTTALSALTFYGGVSSSGLTVGTTTITGGTNTKVLYNNNGVVGEYTVTGTGNAVLSSSPTFTSSLMLWDSIAASILRASIKNTSTTGYSACTVYNDDATKSVFMATFNSAGAVGGAGSLYANNTAWLGYNASSDCGIINQLGGDWVLALNGFDTTKEKLRISTTVTKFKSNTVNFDQLTASTVPYLDASKNLVSSSVTPTQLSYLDATSSIQTQLNAKTDIFTLHANHVKSALSASTTYYYSDMFFAADSPRTTVGQSLSSIPYNCTLIGASITTWNASSGTSATASTVNFRVNGVDNLISSNVTWNNGSASPNSINVTGLNVAVTAGQTWEIKLVMGALATAPNAGYCKVTLYFQKS